jgi:hypothetical protein
MLVRKVLIWHMEASEEKDAKLKRNIQRSITKVCASFSISAFRGSLTMHVILGILQLLVISHELLREQSC